MKASFTFSCLFIASTIFATSAECSIVDKAPSLFQHYLAVCEQERIENQPVHLRSASQEKDLFFNDITILDLDIPLAMPIETVAERILYGDADVVHLANTSTQRTSHLYQILEKTYPHFIHVPYRERGMLIASKYPLSQATMTLVGEGNSADKEILEFTIHGANTYYVSVDSNSFSMQIINPDNVKDASTTPIVLFDVPGTLTIVKQQFSPLRLAHKADLLAAEMFQILPIKHKGEGSSDDRGGYKAEVEVGRSWGGKDGGCWEGSARFEAYDNHGNYVETEANQNDKGEGSVNARAGHEEK